ncbi:MAG: aspartate ammonia-lyase [Candidatus Cloacimonetes bacterium]|nr:aspartate ammonia-lyase [Candidatus Cloacimonadota bacterium]
MSYNAETFLSEVSLFAGLSQECLKWTASVFSRVEVNKDQILFEEGQPRQYFFVIESGEVELLRRLPAGREISMITFRNHDFFGESCLFDDAPHSTSARVVRPTVLWRASASSWIEFSRKHPDLFLPLLSRVSKLILNRTAVTAPFSDTASRYLSGKTRREHDFLGERDVSDEHYYGIQTLRALENFSISGVPIRHYPRLIHALAMVKQAAARANCKIQMLSQPLADAIETACREILDGKWHTHFVVDMIQGGAGTSTNMNANEVIANRALEILGKNRGEYDFCHPNNHVNLSQSTNDVYPTALKLAILNYNQIVIKDLQKLIDAFSKKALEFSHIVKMGRTQLQDAVPMTLGQSFSAWSQILQDEIDGLNRSSSQFLSINLGGTAIGTGINADPDYPQFAVMALREISGYDFVLAPNLVANTQDTGSFLEYSNALRRLGVKLSKICNDLRLLSSGPRAGLGEISLPEMQPGSSIMPGKVNPVIPEVVNQIAHKVIGNDLSVTLASEAGQLELNVMEPVIAQSILESMEMLISGMSTLRIRCIEGITANEDVCREFVRKSIGIVTALVPVLGYETCSKLAKEAQATGKGLYELVLERRLLPESELQELLSPERMVNPVPLKRVLE